MTLTLFERVYLLKPHLKWKRLRPQRRPRPEGWMLSFCGYAAPGGRLFRGREATACCPEAAPRARSTSLCGLDGKRHPTHRHPGGGARPLVLTSGGQRGRGCPGCGCGRAPVRAPPWSSARFPSRPADVSGGPLAPPQEGPRSLSRSTSLVCRFTSKGGSRLRLRLSPVVPGTLASTRCVSR